MQVRALDDLSKAELIELIKKEREQMEGVGAGGISHNRDAERYRFMREQALSEKGDHDAQMIAATYLAATVKYFDEINNDVFDASIDHAMEVINGNKTE